MGLNRYWLLALPCVTAVIVQKINATGSEAGLKFSISNYIDSCEQELIRRYEVFNIPCPPLQPVRFDAKTFPMPAFKNNRVLRDYQEVSKEGGLLECTDVSRQSTSCMRVFNLSSLLSQSGILIAGPGAQVPPLQYLCTILPESWMLVLLCLSSCLTKGLGTCHKFRS